jgi:hypothetical protein
MPPREKGRQSQVSQSTKKSVLVDSLNGFTPTLLPHPRSIASDSVLQAFNDSVSKGTKMDFTVLTEEKRIEWLKFFSDTVVKLSNEVRVLRGQLDQYSERALVDSENQAKVNFTSKVSSAIKSGMFKIFTRLIFPSTVEVTSSRDRRALLSFGLTDKCALATLVFDAIFSSSQGTVSMPITVVDDISSPPSLTTVSSSKQHPFDTPSLRAQLWFDYGLGTFSVKTINATRNTYTNLIRDVVSKFLFFFPLTLLFYLFISLCFFFSCNPTQQKTCSRGYMLPLQYSIVFLLLIMKSAP